MKRRKILFITGSRGEYGYIRPILNLIKRTGELEYEIVGTNMHLLPEFGDSIVEFVKDGFEVKHMPLMTLSGYTPASMLKSISLFGLSLADIIPSSKPDIILLAGDRGEQLIAAIAGSHMNIPVAHIQAGEVSGNIDGLSRHAIARFTHIHFAANKDAEQRLIRSGEQKFRVFNVGAPQLDEFVSGDVTPLTELKKKYRGIDGDFILLVQHSVTEQNELAYEQVKLTLSVLEKIGKSTVAILPNSDAGSALVIKAFEDNSFVGLHAHRNVPRQDYAGFLKNALCIVGNSSSGILEAPIFSLPAVNIGRRQEGRYQGPNVINCEHDFEAIFEGITRALSREFRDSLVNMGSPYGDGGSSARIVDILKNLNIDDRLLQKKLTF
jgi:GDP/UDP-N,N'-diacetylbacillosamine 2-epimerase (hydrolysing)